MKKIISIINQIKNLLSKDDISFQEAETLMETYDYEPLRYYLDNLLHRVKPETATSEFFKAIASDVLAIDVFPEVTVKGGFIDFAIEQPYSNPILLELKPLFKIDKENQLMKTEIILYQSHKNQIQKYLKSNEYVILTNLRDIFLFNREALIDYAPFYQMDFITFIESYLAYENLWDYVRRIEDQIPRLELDKLFFEDLKKWYSQIQMVDMHQANGFDKEELIVLFLNKMIFIKTLEDYGLIPFKFLEDDYFDKRNRWYVKGETIIFDFFFSEIESWFWMFYDTELFRTKFWDFVDKDSSNVKNFRKTFETVLGFGNWQQAFGKGMIHYNYRLIDEDVFGKAYESFIAENRKDSGIYYTPQPITQYMAEKLVALLFDDLVDKILAAINTDDYGVAQSFFDQLQQIKIIDPCSGSGSFLIKVLRKIFHRYTKIGAELDAKEKIARKEIDVSDIFSEKPQYVKDLGKFVRANGFDDTRLLISKIILNHIYAVDIDDRALETAKTNIWKEAIKLDPPSFRFSRLPEDKNHILPYLELNFINADSLMDMDLATEIEIIAEEFGEQIQKMMEIRNQYLDDPFHPEVLDDIVALKQEIRQRLTQEIPEFDNPLFLAVEFFFAYFDETGKPLPESQRGLDAIISNPPWEAIKPVRKEFADIGKGELDIKEFNKLFNKRLKKDTKFKKRWDEYKQFYRDYSKFLKRRYDHQGGGDPNYYKVFTERDLEIVRDNGIMSILIPSGIQTDKGTSNLRKMIFQNYKLMELYSFENKGYDTIVKEKETHVKLFPDVDSRFKFSIFSVKKEENVDDEYHFNAKFYLHHPEELYTEPIDYRMKMVKNFSPENWSIMEFTNERDYQICARICNENKTLGELEFQLRREFDMTLDSSLFKKKKPKEGLTLFEGKMIHQYNSNYSTPRYYLDEIETKSELIRKEAYRIKRGIKKTTGNKFDFEEEDFNKNNFRLGYQTYRMVFRAVGRSTDERTIISSIVPPQNCFGNSLINFVNFSYELKDDKLIQNKLNYNDLVYVMALFNSLTLNYYIRNKISANLNMFYIYELPIADATADQKAEIVEKAYRLLAYHDKQGEFQALGKALGVEVDRCVDPQDAPAGSPLPIIQTRAELEVLIARELYGLSKDDWDYLTSTFVYGSDKSATKQELDAIIERSLEMF